MVLRSWPSAGFGGRAPGLRPFRRVNSEGRQTLSCDRFADKLRAPQAPVSFIGLLGGADS
jgi:hypothetical protein